MKSYNLLVLTPATVRPDVLNECLATFFGRCFGRSYERNDPHNNFRLSLSLHIDNVGCKDGKCNPGDIEEVARKYYANIRSINFNEENCSLSKAFYWLWSEAIRLQEVDYVFYLEDDWVLEQDVDIVEMMKIMDKYISLATLRLNRFSTDATFSKQWSHKFPWNGEFFECKAIDKPHIGWCGHPTLVRPQFIRQTHPYLSDSFCPERQMKGLYGNTPMWKVLRRWEYGVYGKPGSSPYISDIGRIWRARNNIVKYANTSWHEGKAELI